MAIEKMSLVHIVGAIQSLDTTLVRCCNSGVFHVELPGKTAAGRGFAPIREENPYGDILQAVTDVMSELSLETKYYDYTSLSMKKEEVPVYLGRLKEELLGIKQHKTELKDRLTDHKQALAQVRHLDGLNIRFTDLINSQNSTTRFGKLPVDSYLKLDYFSNRSFFFFDFDHDEDYYWGFYLAANTEIEDIDQLFASLYFETIDISEYAHETPQLAIEALQTQIQIEEEAIRRCDGQVDAIREREAKTVDEIYAKAKMLHDTFSYRRYATSSGNRFYLEGFVPTRKVKEFTALFDDLDHVLCEQEQVRPEMKVEPPVQLRTNRFFKPFEMFITMYGLPGYYDFNPTSFVGFIYVLLFGMMFGDFGQGICVILFGLLIWKWKKMVLGQALMRCGIASMFFGLLYGSFFGIEGSFKPLFEAVGLGDIFPLDVLDSNTSTMLLIISLAIGVVIVVAAMLINIVTGLRKKDYGKALFSSNGIAGLLFYCGIVGAAALLVLFKVNVFNPVFILLVIVLPLVLIFFHEPLGEKVKNRRRKNAEKEKFSVVDASFEIFDVLLSYCTNTLSFLRVGGFVLSHAALMLVVMTFAHMAGSFGSPIVIVLGNAFVMALEGLIVGIQVLRLVYYETFSRFYESKGKPYHPVKINYSTEEEK